MEISIIEQLNSAVCTTIIIINYPKRLKYNIYICLTAYAHFDVKREKWKPQPTPVLYWNLLCNVEIFHFYISNMIVYQLYLRYSDVSTITIMACLLVETVRAFTHVINQGWAMYWGSSRWSPTEIMVGKVYVLGILPLVSHGNHGG